MYIIKKKHDQVKTIFNDVYFKNSEKNIFDKVNLDHQIFNLFFCCAMIRPRH